LYQASCTIEVHVHRVDHFDSSWFHSFLFPLWYLSSTWFSASLEVFRKLPFIHYA